MAFLDDAARQTLAAVEHKFLFRKIGLPFDYASDPDDFPSKAFATAKEARANQPNPQGLGAGYHYSCRNHALLFDAYLLRMELGVETSGDEAILDRLIGGLIRLATVAPKSFLVGGLAPDGRGFYALSKRTNHAAWAFAAMRGLHTAAISPESQEKFRSIIGKWIDRLRRDKFRLNTAESKAVPGFEVDVAKADGDSGPLYLAMLLTAARSSGAEADYEAYVAAAEEGGRARLLPHVNAEIQENIHTLLWRQACLHLIAHYDPDAERMEIAKRRLHENAQAASRRIVAWRGWDAGLADTPVNLDWRKQPKVPLEESSLGFQPHESWARLDREWVFVDALTAMYTMLLAGDAEFLEPHAAEMEACLTETPWEKMASLVAVAPVAGIHARGVELGLWDKTLYDARRESPSSEMSFAAKYLEPDYDEANPEQAGHSDTPPGKKKVEAKAEGGAKKRRRRRRR